MAWTRKTDGNRWKGSYRDHTGKERSKTFDRKRDADKWSQDQERAVTQGEWINPDLSRTTVETWALHWLPTLVHLRPATVDRTTRTIHNHVLPQFGKRKLGSLTSNEMQTWIGQLQASGMAASTIRSTVQVLSSLLSGAVTAGLIGKNPGKGLRLPTPDHREMAFLDPSAVAGLADAIPEHYRPLVLTAAYCGLRWGELAGLKVERVNPLLRNLIVVEQVTEISGHLSWGPPKTAAGRRSVALPATIARMLGQQVTSGPSVQSGLVFPSPNGQVLRRTNFRRRVWLPALRAAELPETVRFHDLRHTAVALAIAQGAHVKVIQERMGHASVQMTLDRYGHLFPSLHDQIADDLDAVLVASLNPVRPLSGLGELDTSGQAPVGASDQEESRGASWNRTSDLTLIRGAL